MARLKCTDGNYQCGSICQNNSKKCYSNLSAEDGELAKQFASLIGKKGKEARPEDVRQLVQETMAGQKVPKLATVQKWLNDLPEQDVASIVDNYANFWGEKLGLKPIGNKPADKAANLLVSAILNSSNKPEIEKELGQGAYGKVSLTKAGTALKEPKGDADVHMFANKDEATTYADISKLGLAPELIAKYDDGSIEISFLAGYKTFADAKVPYAQRADKKLQIAKQVVKMHEAGYYHGDLHDENVMLSDEGDIKFIDFGRSGKLAELGEKLIKANSPMPAGYAQYRMLQADLRWWADGSFKNIVEQEFSKEQEENGEAYKKLLASVKAFLG